MSYYNFARGCCADVYDCLRGHPDGITMAEVSREIGVPVHEVKRCMRKLEYNGHVEKVRPYTKPFKWRKT